MPSQIVLILSLFFAGFFLSTPVTDVVGAGLLVVAGNGAELPVIQKLAKAFEKANPGTAIQFRWNRNLKVTTMVKSGQADLAVTGHADSELNATQIAWDGIAVIVNFSNPVKEVTRDQVARLFGGQVTVWSELDGNEENVEVIRRPADRNLNEGFEEQLGIVGKIPATAKSIRSDQKVLSTVTGRLSAVSYLSLGAALEAVKYGTPIRILIIDRVEAAEPTVQDGRYKLRRPVLFLSNKEPSPVRDAFIAFALSPKGQQIIRKQYVPSSTPR